MSKTDKSHADNAEPHTHGYAFIKPEVIAATVARDIDAFEAGLTAVIAAVRGR